MTYILAISVRSLFFGRPGLRNDTTCKVSRVSTVYPTCTETKFLHVLHCKSKLVRIGSKINHTNKANPRKTTTSSNYSQVPENVGIIDREDSTVYYCCSLLRDVAADIDFFSLAIPLGLSPFAVQPMFWF